MDVLVEIVQQVDQVEEELEMVKLEIHKMPKEQQHQLSMRQHKVQVKMNFLILNSLVFQKLND